mgnify:CR=1 FL=1
MNIDCHLKAKNYINGQDITEWEILSIDNTIKFAEITKEGNIFYLHSDGKKKECTSPLEAYADFQKELWDKKIH